MLIILSIPEVMLISVCNVSSGTLTDGEVNNGEQRHPEGSRVTSRRDNTQGSGERERERETLQDNYDSRRKRCLVLLPSGCGRTGESGMIHLFPRAFSAGESL